LPATGSRRGTNGGRLAFITTSADGLCGKIRSERPTGSRYLSNRMDRKDVMASASRLYRPFECRASAMAVAAVVVLAACAASSHVLVGTARTPIAPEQVKIYLQPPPRYEEIATIDASSRGTPVFTDQRKMDRAIGRLKQEAAKLGANGILLEGTSDQQTGGIGLGTGSASGNSAFGIGTSFGIVIKTATGIAIYVAP
jgi:hypothetical protein